MTNFKNFLDYVASNENSIIRVFGTDFGGLLNLAIEEVYYWSNRGKSLAVLCSDSDFSDLHALGGSRRGIDISQLCRVFYSPNLGGESFDRILAIRESVVMNHKGGFASFYADKARFNNREYFDSETDRVVLTITLPKS